MPIPGVFLRASAFLGDSPNSPTDEVYIPSLEGKDLRVFILVFFFFVTISRT